MKTQTKKMVPNLSLLQQQQQQAQQVQQPPQNK